MFIKYKLVYHPCNLTVQLDDIQCTLGSNSVLVIQAQSTKYEHSRCAHCLFITLCCPHHFRRSDSLPSANNTILFCSYNNEDRCNSFIYGFPLALLALLLLFNNTSFFELFYYIQEIVYLFNDATILRHRCSSNKTPHYYHHNTNNNKKKKKSPDNLSY